VVQRHWRIQGGANAISTQAINEFDAVLKSDKFNTSCFLQISVTQAMLPNLIAQQQKMYLLKAL